MKKIKIRKKIIGDFLENKKSKKIVIFYHGLFCDKEDSLIKEAFFYFNKKGFNVFKFNFFNNKKDIENITIRKYLDKMNLVLKFFDKKDYEIINIGHSFGGLIILLYFILFKEKKIKNKISKNILWDPTKLQGLHKSKNIDNFFIYNKKTRKYDLVGIAGAKINKTFFNDLTKRSYDYCLIKTYKTFLNIVAGTKRIEFYNKKLIPRFSIKEADHNFSKKKFKKELFEKSINFINKK